MFEREGIWRYCISSVYATQCSAILEISGCLTAFGVFSGHHVVRLPRVQVLTDGGFQGFGCGVGAAGEIFSEWRIGSRELFQRGQGVKSHGMPIQTATRLVERPESLAIVRIKFKGLLDEALGNFGGRQVHLVEGAERRQQIKPLQPRKPG